MNCSFVEIKPPLLEKKYEEILNAQIRYTEKLNRIECIIVSTHRKWWNKWLYHHLSDEEILNESFYALIQRFELREAVKKLTILGDMCADALIVNTSVTFSSDDYGLIMNNP